MSKLTEAEKYAFNIACFEFNGGFYQFPHSRVTFAVLETGPNRAKIAWAISSKDETKFRKNRGKFEALKRLYNSGGMPVEFCDMYPLKEICETIANNITFD